MNTSATISTIQFWHRLTAHDAGASTWTLLEVGLFDIPVYVEQHNYLISVAKLG